MAPPVTPRTIEIFVPLGEPVVGEAFVAKIARTHGVAPSEVAIERRSLDARKGRPIGHLVRVRLGAVELPPRPQPPPRALAGMRVVIAGSGPCGTFAALRLAEAGASVTLCDVGKPVQPRRHDLAKLVRKGELDETSNYCFGEGGAGTFSDGKLYTRTKDRAATDEVLSILVEHGADPSIRIDARPHVGSNHLPKILTRLRERLEALGVRYVWSAPLVGMDVRDGRVVGARLGTGEELPCDALLIAVGHSARSTMEWLVAAGVAAEAKPFAIGCRVEHPQPLIDRIQYGKQHGHPALPAAFYHVTARAPGGGVDRGIWSFCMCPGGWIVDSSTEAGHLATNGMSLSRRDSPYANAAMIVDVLPRDLAGIPGPPALAGLALQREVEARAFAAGGGGYVAPAQKLVDFAAGKASATVGRSSYRPRVVGADLATVLPSYVAEALRAAVPRLDRAMRGFASADAQLVGVETRTSSPVRFLRDATTLESPTHAGLYPLGEGAGYAGGIVSAAIDGLRAADAILRRTGRG